MTGKLVGSACVLLGAVVAAQGSSPRLPRSEGFGSVSVPAATGMTCQGGRYAEMGNVLPSGDFNCQRQPGLTATALAIDVGPSMYAYVNNPPCPGGNTDTTTIAMARSQVGTTTVTPHDMLTQLQRRASLLGSDAPALVVGGVSAGAARCQLFVLQTPVAASAIRVIEFRAHQNQASDLPQCFESKLDHKSAASLALWPAVGGCAISWSGWQSATIVDDPKGAVVAGVFKNWSHDRTRTGQLWVWYSNASQPSAPQAPSGLRIIR